MNNKKTEKIIKELLVQIGEDPTREGLQKTPYRVAKMFTDLTIGYKTSLKSVVNNAIFAENVQNMITLRDIELYSLCEHHLLPFIGKCHVGYIPNKKKLLASVKLPESLICMPKDSKYRKD